MNKVGSEPEINKPNDLKKILRLSKPKLIKSDDETAVKLVEIITNELGNGDTVLVAHKTVKNNQLNKTIKR